MKQRKGAVLVEVLVALFITAFVFVAVYTTIGVALINTRYLKQVRATSEFATQYAEAFAASANCDGYSIFDYIKDNYSSVSGVIEIDMTQAAWDVEANGINGDETVDYRKLIDSQTLTDYRVQLFLLSPNAVYLSENSLGTPFGTGIYSPDDELMTFELRVQRNSQDWGIADFRLYKERQPAVISYIFQVHRGQK